MLRDYFSKLRENPLIKHWVVPGFMAVTFAVGLFVGMEALRNTEDMRDDRERSKEISEIVRQVDQGIGERTKNCILYDNQIGIDVEGNSALNLIVGYMGARPGSIYYKKPTLKDQQIYRLKCL